MENSTSFGRHRSTTRLRLYGTGTCRWFSTLVSPARRPASAQKLSKVKNSSLDTSAPKAVPGCSHRP